MIDSGLTMIRHTFLFPALFLLALLASAMPDYGWADDVSEPFSHLRIVYGEAQTQPNGAVLLPLEIRFGNVEGVNCLESLSGVMAGVATLPARVDSEKQTKPLVYRSVPVSRTGEKWTILLCARSPLNFAVRIQAWQETNGRKTYLSAETNCFVFGRTLGANTESKAEALPPAWFSGLGMSINPPFYYWPQTEDPLQVTLHLAGRTLAKKTLTVFDGLSPVRRFLTDDAGRIVYVPPDDPALNRRSEKAAKQVFLVSVHSEGDDLFVATRTLRLHRNRLSHLQLDMGMALFGTTALVTGGTVIWMRRWRWPA